MTNLPPGSIFDFMIVEGRASWGHDNISCSPKLRVNGYVGFRVIQRMIEDFQDCSSSARERNLSLLELYKNATENALRFGAALFERGNSPTIAKRLPSLPLETSRFIQREKVATVRAAELKRIGINSPELSDGITHRVYLISGRLTDCLYLNTQELSETRRRNLVVFVRLGDGSVKILTDWLDTILASVNKGLGFLGHQQSLVNIITVTTQVMADVAKDYGRADGVNIMGQSIKRGTLHFSTLL